MKLDLYKTHKAEYAAPKKPIMVEIKPAQYLVIEGRGEPGGPEFQAAIGALYNVAFTVKMAYKFAGKKDYGVCKLECTYQDRTIWRLMIRTPDFIKTKDLEQAQAKLLAKGKDAAVGRVKLIRFAEGSCVQMLHIGPYTRICDTLAVMEAFARENNKLSGGCHEIYLSDPRRVAPAKLKTILRQRLAV
jgi:hypothetical protein